MRTNFIVDSVLSGLRRNLTMTVALIMSTAITLAFVGAGLLANKEAAQFKRTYEGRLNVTVIVCGTGDTDIKTCTSRPVIDKKTGKQEVIDGVKQYDASITTAQRTALENRFKSDSRVRSAKYVDADEAYRQVKEAQGSDARYIQPGDIPPYYLVKLSDIKADYEPFVKTFSSVQGVGKIANQSDVLNKLLDTINGFRLFSLVAALVVLIASILLIANTIQVAAQQRRNETSIMRLVGASRWMTELPFLLETVIATIIGGVISSAMLFVGKHFVLNNIFKVQVDNGVIPNLSSNDILVACGEGLIAGAVVAAVTAFLTLRLYVKL